MFQQIIGWSKSSMQVIIVAFSNIFDHHFSQELIELSDLIYMMPAYKTFRCKMFQCPGNACQSICHGMKRVSCVDILKNITKQPFSHILIIRIFSKPAVVKIKKSNSCFSIKQTGPINPGTCYFQDVRNFFNYPIYPR